MAEMGGGEFCYANRHVIIRLEVQRHNRFPAMALEAVTRGNLDAWILRSDNHMVVHPVPLKQRIAEL